jgi:uncharacterized membrane protein YsdA (DUF1294 family)
MTQFLVAYLGTVFMMSIVCFVTYGWDKRRALNGGRRVPENTLQLLAFFGGWPGAIIGQRHFRHKTQKLPFLIVFWAVVVLHLAVVGSVGYSIFG